jgi:hypothetical protein
MKALLTLSFATALLSQAALAELPPIEHATCKVSPRAEIAVKGSAKPSTPISWSQDETMSLRFRERGFSAGDYKSIEELADGDLFTSLVFTCGGGKYEGKQVYQCSAQVEIRRRDSSQPTGSLLIGKGSSPGTDTHYKYENALYDELVEALKGVPACVVKSPADES